jgi:hypothetical protein
MSKAQRQQKAKAKAAAVRRRNVENATAERQSIRLELNRPGDPGFGTSPASLGIVKAASEEARYVTCPDCGYGGGRHARMCERAQ